MRSGRQKAGTNVNVGIGVVDSRFELGFDSARHRATRNCRVLQRKRSNYNGDLCKRLVLFFWPENIAPTFDLRM